MGRRPYTMSGEHREKIRQGQLKRWGISDAEKCIFSHRTVMRIIAYSSKFQKVRDERLKEKGSVCEICGAIDNLHLHHKKPLKELVEEFFQLKGYGVSRLDIYQWNPFYNKYNLVVRCKSCHAREIVSHRKSRSVGYGYKCFETLRKMRENDLKNKRSEI